MNVNYAKFQKTFDGGTISRNYLKLIELFTDTAAILNLLLGFPGGKHAKCFRDGICHFSLQRCIFCKLSIMGDQPDENTKEFSKEELNVWNVEKLRKYLKDRRIVITSDTYIHTLLFFTLGF